MTMGQVSALNPNAPAFVPMAYYDAVEDFSDQWWNLVQSSPYFRDYWLEECFQDPDEYDEILFHDIDSIFFEQQHLSSKQEEEEVERDRKDMDLVSLEKLKWERDHKARSCEIEALRKLREKTPKIVNVKLSPRTINQPR